MGVKPKSVQKKDEPQPFAVAGIGGSAGGLEAFSELLHYLPVNLGMAYIYIQHLSANHESFLPDIMQKKTPMKVLEIKHNMPIEQNTVYIAPARQSVSISEGRLKLRLSTKQHPSYVIDFCFNELALH